MAELKMEHVYKRYQRGTFVLQDCSLEISGKELILLLGGADSGKTTMLKLLAGIENASMGEIYLDGQLVYNGMREHNTSMIFQHGSRALYPKKTVYENIGFNLKKQKLTKAEIAERIEEAAELMGVADYLNEQSERLSAGLKQEVMMARAFAKRPKLVLIDDPMSDIFVHGWNGERHKPMGHSLLEKVKLLYEKLDAIVIYATRDVGEAWNLDKRAILLEEGQITQFGELREIQEELSVAMGESLYEGIAL